MAPHPRLGQQSPILVNSLDTDIVSLIFAGPWPGCTAVSAPVNVLFLEIVILREVKTWMSNVLSSVCLLFSVIDWDIATQAEIDT